MNRPRSPDYHNLALFAHAGVIYLTGRETHSVLQVLQSLTACLSVAAVRDSAGLSEREAQIAYHAVLGKADRDIAASLLLSLPTVRTHLRHIYRKLRVNNRSSLCRRLTRPDAVSPS